MWKVKWKGKYIVLRDIADKTIEWVNKFKTLGNIIAQGDPVHAAIPWVPVRYLIEVCSMIYTCTGHTLLKLSSSNFELLAADINKESRSS